MYSGTPSPTFPRSWHPRTDKSDNSFLPGRHGICRHPNGPGNLGSHGTTNSLVPLGSILAFITVALLVLLRRRVSRETVSKPYVSQQLECWAPDAQCPESPGPPRVCAYSTLRPRRASQATSVVGRIRPPQRTAADLFARIATTSTEAGVPRQEWAQPSAVGAPGTGYGWCWRRVHTSKDVHMIRLPS